MEGSPCRTLDNLAGKALDAFAKISRFDVEDHYVVFHWFDRLKTKVCTKGILQFCDLENQEVIKYILIPWLCKCRKMY